MLSPRSPSAKSAGATRPNPDVPIATRVNQSENDDPSIIEGIETGVHIARVSRSPRHFLRRRFFVFFVDALREAAVF